MPTPTHRLLLIEYVASTASGHSAVKALERKDKRSLPAPVRPTFLPSHFYSSVFVSIG